MSKPDKSCGLGVGCDEAGICYAEAHGQPSKCPHAPRVIQGILPPARLKRVILESPFGANPDLYIPYARRAVADCIQRGEAPLASHLLYTQPGILDDSIPDERNLGIAAGLSWHEVAEGCVAYLDHGISQGMIYGIQHARNLGLTVEERYIGQ